MEVGERGAQSLALITLGGGEIILILCLLLVLAAGPLFVAGVVYLIVRAATRQPAAPAAMAAAAENQRWRDREHLNLLSIFHFIFAGLALLGMLFLVVHYCFMSAVISNPAAWQGRNGATPMPVEFRHIFIVFYAIAGGIMLVALVLNLSSAIFLRRRQHWLFSMIVGGLNCAQVPMGTTLGVFTFIVLSRDTVRELYAKASSNQ